MNKSEFLTLLSGQLPYTRDEINFLFEIIAENIKDGLASNGEVRTPIGKFKVVKRASRRIRDISTKELRTLPEREEIKFFPNKKLTE